MSPETRRYLVARWPSYFEWLGAIIAVCVLGMAVSVWQNWWTLLPIFAGGILAASYFFAASTWLVERLYDNRRIADAVWPLCNLSPNDHFVYIDCGLRNTAIEVSKNLMRGTLNIVDVYNPQLMPDEALKRIRNYSIENTVLPLSDPRTTWLEGRFDLLPQLDSTVPVVVCNQVLGELALSDRKLLLNEMRRILQPGGRLLIVERVKHKSQSVYRLALNMNWDSAEMWQANLENAGLELHDENQINTILTVFRADAPAAPSAQMRFRF